MRCDELFLNEMGRRERVGRVLYSGPSETTMQAAKKFHDGYNKVITALRLSDVFADAALHASSYSSYLKTNAAGDIVPERLLNIKFGIPDGYDAGAAGFFIKMAVKAVTAHIGKPDSFEIRNKSREFFHSADEFLVALKRRKTPETQGDSLDINITFTP